MISNIKKYSLALGLMFVSCAQRNVKINKTDYIIKEGASPLSIIEIDSVQYLYGQVDGQIIFTLKGHKCKCKED